MSEEEILDIIRNRVGIEITQFNAYYLNVTLTLDGVAFAEAQADVPSYEIREGLGD